MAGVSSGPAFHNYEVRNTTVSQSGRHTIDATRRTIIEQAAHFPTYSYIPNIV